MKKQFLNLGKALNKTEQKQIFGGEREPAGMDPGEPCSSCSVNSDCNSGVCMTSSGDCEHLPCGCKSNKHCL